MWDNVCSVLGSLHLSICQASGLPTLNGYIEIEPIRIAASSGGRITQMLLNTGDAITAGQVLFKLDDTNEQAALQAAQARLQQAQAQATDLTTGKRPVEVVSLQANLQAAQANLKQAESELSRQQRLVKQGYLPKANLDSYIAQRDTAAANVRAANAQIQAAHLAGREQTQVAASANVQALQDTVTQAQWALAQKSISAAVNARVEQRYYQAGEWVNAGAPVLSLLPTNAYKVRFFLPEPQIDNINVGNKLTVQCDGCAKPFTAQIRYIANMAEFTPPVLYTQDQRAKLVYLVEAIPTDTTNLHAGQPVNIILQNAVVASP